MILNLKSKIIEKYINQIEDDKEKMLHIIISEYFLYIYILTLDYIEMLIFS